MRGPPVAYSTNQFIYNRITLDGVTLLHGVEGLSEGTHLPLEGVTTVPVGGGGLSPERQSCVHLRRQSSLKL